MQGSAKENISITTIEFRTKNSGKENVIFSFVVPFLCLFFAVTGLTGCFVTSFFVKAKLPLLYGGLFVFCLFWTLFSKWKIEGVYRFLAFVAVLIFVNIGLIFMQGPAISGFFQTANGIFECLNESYHGSIPLYQVSENGLYVSIFLLFVLFPITGLLSFGVVKKQNVWYLAAAAFPVLFGSCLVQGKPSEVYLFFLFFAFLGLLAEGVVEEPYDDGEKSKSKEAFYQKVKSKVMLVSFLPLLCLSILSFCVLTPLFMYPVGQVRDMATKSENGVLQVIWSVLPGISGSSLQLEGVGGGVDEGYLGRTEGYYFGNTKALKVVVGKRPQETLYLKGYVGSVYTGKSFDATDENKFLSAARNWKVEGDSSLYVQNLPFLRMMYAENLIFSGVEGEEQQMADNLTSSAVEIQVDNLNANPSYTYLPYNAFLNDYYEIMAGDGAVASQTRAEDIFSYYPVEIFEEKMEEWQQKEDAHGILDSVEAAYESYVKGTYLQIPETGLEQLKAECEAAQLQDVEEIKEYIITTLGTNTAFSTDVEYLPEGKDFVSWFLYESKEGYSTHYAAAATMMFRMFGVPARYVVGYVAPERLFTMQSDGSYMAVIEDDNAHAWTEIYVSGAGWVPVETTPGFVAMVTDGSAENTNSNQTEASKEDSRQEENKQGDAQSTQKGEEADASDAEKQSKWLTILLFTGAVLLVVATFFIIRRMYLVKKRTGQRGNVAVDKNIRHLYSSFCSMLAFDDWLMAPGCEAENFPEKMHQRYIIGGEEEWQQFAMLILKTYYGYDERTEEDLQFLQKMYKKVCLTIYKRLSFGKRLHFYWWKCYM